MPEHSLDGRSERALKLEREAERGTTRSGKKRALRQLPASTRHEIVRLYNEENVLQKDIADKFRVSVSLVGRLVREFSRQPEKEEQREAKGKRAQQVLEVVGKAVDEQMRSNTPIMSSD